MPYQIVEPGRRLRCAALDGPDERVAAAQLDAERRHRFELEPELPIRVAVLRTREREHVLSLVVHHIAADHWSAGVLFADVLTAYRARRAGERAVLGSRFRCSTRLRGLAGALLWRHGGRIGLPRAARVLDPPARPGCRRTPGCARTFHATDAQRRRRRRSTSASTPPRAGQARRAEPRTGHHRIHAAANRRRRGAAQGGRRRRTSRWAPRSPAAPRPNWTSWSAFSSTSWCCATT